VSASGLPTPAPEIAPEARPFWAAAARGRLLLQRCAGCAAVVWYPRGLCPACGGTSLEWFEASGRGTVYSYTVVRRGAAGPYADATPYVLAYVELEEGPRILTNVVHADVDAVRVGDAVRAVFEPAGEDAGLVRFAPA
jgi:uncharacterized OB-fold protein